MNPAEALAAIDKVEESIHRIRNLDVGLKNALVAELDRLRGFAASGVMVGDRLMIKPKARECSKEEMLAVASKVMEDHKDTFRALADM
jgi:hypothetical protein